MTHNGPSILTADDRYYFFNHPSVNVTLNAVARGLANTCRFGGQCQQFYSVAEHSIYVSRLVPAPLALWGLMHDASEAFIGDMPKPLKEVLPDYKALEKRIEGPILAAFGLEGAMPREVKDADMAMLSVEQVQVMANHDPWSWTIHTDDAHSRIKVAFLSPQEAYEAFVQRFVEVCDGLGLAMPDSL